MGPLTLLVVLSLVAYRVTRLIVKDDFPPVQWLRDVLVGPDETKLDGTRMEWFGKLITCYWCASFWVAGVTVAVAEAFQSVPLPFLMWWAVAGVAAYLVHLEEGVASWVDSNDARTREINRQQRTADLWAVKMPADSPTGTSTYASHGS